MTVIPFGLATTTWARVPVTVSGPSKVVRKAVPGACHFIDDGARVCRAVVQLDAMAWHIEMGVSVMTCPSGAGWGLDIDDNGRAGSAGLADLGRVGMFDDTGDVRCKHRQCKHMDGQKRGCEKAAETHAEADMVHLHPLQLGDRIQEFDIGLDAVVLDAPLAIERRTGADLTRQAAKIHPHPATATGDDVG